MKDYSKEPKEASEAEESMEGSCACSLPEDGCKEAYLEAYKCYLKNKNTPRTCLPLIKALKECYASRTPASKKNRFLARLSQMLSRLTTKTTQ
ncbi:hypothetical protein NECID01_0552 [Nematocida sp. AWRm77]|nr:hypothetical protein NECID01_0552 [Nematocida sp. AWRm77]